MVLLYKLSLSGADPGKNLTGLLESERRIYGSPEACFPAKVFRFPLSKITLTAIFSHLAPCASGRADKFAKILIREDLQALEKQTGGLIAAISSYGDLGERLGS